VRGKMSVFEVPTRVETIAGGAQKRSTIRMDVLVSGAWRFAPGGHGIGEFLRGSIRDISRGGCALIMDRQCKVGQMLEVRLNLKSGEPPLMVLGEVKRFEQVPTSGKFSHGLRFHGVRPSDDQAITEFINSKLAELRSRGLA
jgi:c-di-GMP-binding flagellar brake protein YcgR